MTLTTAMGNAFWVRRYAMAFRTAGMDLMRGVVQVMMPFCVGFWRDSMASKCATLASHLVDSRVGFTSNQKVY